MKKYYPILLSKEGELSALAKLYQNSKNQVVPILQVLSENISKIETFHSQWNFNGNELFLDFSLANSLDSITISNLITHLLSNGVNIVPVIQENSHPQYLTAISDLISKLKIKKTCIRFSNNSGGFQNINTVITSFATNLGINRNQISLLLDFGLLNIINHNSIPLNAIIVINSIQNRNDYENTIVASGSFLDNLGTLTPPGRVYRLPRYEWHFWLALQAQTNIKDTIKYSDYGTKHPIYDVNAFKGQGSCSIKYTVAKEYVIYRGEISTNHANGNGQYITFSQQLIATNDYSGPPFSWGDERINFHASQIVTNQNRKPGNSKSWVVISQNHHITLLVSIL